VSTKRWSAGVVDEEGLRRYAVALATGAREGGVVFLEGDLGAGKTTFARALLGALGVGERIKSPTYSLVESYRTGELDAHHLDLYRIAEPGELEWLGLPDLFGKSALVVVEWPERGGDALPEPDLVVRLDHAGSRRELTARARTPRGEKMLAAMKVLR
jgi:tRNA threonylcarbamoyladenosine biosynthesis protein TsaE